MERQIEKSNKLSGKMIALMAVASGIAVANMELQHKWWQELSIGQAEKDGKMPFLIYKKLRRSLKWQKFITKKNAA